MEVAFVGGSTRGSMEEAGKVSVGAEANGPGRVMVVGILRLEHHFPPPLGANLGPAFGTAGAYSCIHSCSLATMASG